MIGGVLPLVSCNVLLKCEREVASERYSTVEEQKTAIPYAGSNNYSLTHKTSFGKATHQNEDKQNEVN